MRAAWSASVLGLDRVGESHRELKGVAFGRWKGIGRIVQVTVQGADRKAEVLVCRKGKRIRLIR